MRQKKISRESRVFPLLSINFFDKRNFLKNEGFPYEFFRYCEIKNLRHKVVMPLFCMKIFDTRKFLKHRVVPLRIIPALWGKKISTVKNDNPLLSFKISDTRNFLKGREPPTKIFGAVRKTTFDKIVIHHLMLFFDPEIFWNKRIPLRVFSVLRQKISRENRDNPFLSIKIFDKRIFLKKEGFPYEIFR